MPKDQENHTGPTQPKGGKGRVGKLPPRYGFLLNPFPETRLSRCPRCEGLTYPRKFAFFIHVDDYGAYTQGKTCKYCPRCEIIICHQDELEFELAATFETLKPEVIGNYYLVVGTVEINAWKAGMVNPLTLEELLNHMAQFKEYLNLQFDPGGWRHKDAGPRYLEPGPLNTPWQLAKAARDTGGAGGAGKGQKSGKAGRSSPGGLPPLGPGRPRRSKSWVEGNGGTQGTKMVRSLHSEGSLAYEQHTRNSTISI